MSDTPRKRGANTTVVHSGRAVSRSYGFVNPPVHRGSTVLYPSVADRTKMSARRMDQALIYGLQGSETHHQLENMVAAIEGGRRAQIVPSGLAAVATALMAFLNKGDHLLMPDSCYGPARNFCMDVPRDYGVEIGFYRPETSAAELEPLLRPNTRVVYVESPGSHTFEVQDVPAIAAVAHAHEAKVLADNTWGLHYFQPFSHGVDVSIQALTKYAGGHSDLLLGSICTNAQADWEKVRTRALLLGQYASPDDCWLALRGCRTLLVRLERQAKSALNIAQWLAQRPEVLQVLYPALPGSPGHEIWKRDFSGASSLFSIVLKPEYSVEATQAFVDGMRLFGIGASWGGYESLVVPTMPRNLKRTIDKDYGGTLVRIHIGLEDVEDLTEDLELGFAKLAAHHRAQAERQPA